MITQEARHLLDMLDSERRYMLSLDGPLQRPDSRGFYTSRMEVTKDEGATVELKLTDTGWGIRVPVETARIEGPSLIVEGNAHRLDIKIATI
jgi:hypothetical protein